MTNDEKSHMLFNLRHWYWTGTII